MPAGKEPDARAAEAKRRGLLADSDHLLEQVEELRLADRAVVPERLGQAIRQLQARLGRIDPPAAPTTVRAAHSLVLAVQQRLMAANPRNPNPAPHPGRPIGQPTRSAVGSGLRWKFLALPPRLPSESRDAWLERVDQTVERACDRWAYAQHQVLRAAREGQNPARARALAEAAWLNYYELRSEAERLKASGGSPAARPAHRR
jgi:hypothetical protein